eukprot:Nitzschia sp. Nitz4//scaffold73_size107353//49125//50549//NITZ4_004318-RA/size107353-processed-gene-0.189-mRNA-1//-1//CDS//3329557470//5243//frame0
MYHKKQATRIQRLFMVSPESTSSSNYAPSPLAVSAILASGFLNLLGFTMAGPITPALGQHFQLKVGASFGSLTSSYPLGMLFGLLIWPHLSDHLGRKAILLASLMGSACGLAAQSWVLRTGGSLQLFLVMRALTGAFAGSSPVSKAFLADWGSKNGRMPTYLAWKEAASTMAFIVGPALGGVLYELRRRWTGNAERLQATGSLSFVVGVSAAASLLAAIMIGLFVRPVVADHPKKDDTTPADTSTSTDTESTKTSSPSKQQPSSPLGNTMRSGVLTVCVISFLYNIGDASFHAFFSALLRDNAGLSPGNIGLVYTLLACISFTISATTSSRLLHRWGPVHTCALGLTSTGAGLIALGLAAASRVSFFPPTLPVLAFSAGLYYCGVPLYGPTIPTMLLKSVPAHRRGAIMGLDGTVNTVGRVLSPLLLGEVYRRLGAGVAFGVAGLLSFSGAVVALARQRCVGQQQASTRIGNHD